ncbi:Radical SAM domain protein [Pseudothermotoga lettingae TMO]|uniref:Radical SAM domain protein n=1 Tax=Pseudothermotoga lettingae (strain ATCC BAA-301 / DSM 14385 / NBRC 107922 / TMO) TaxID=416591 RepID=A8F3X1_PSELT|nr:MULTISPECIES: radical SAM protein [Pseudothermotoga]ABV32855.1 Radical SAM domain protein [Pseudothermotoga lettingae TMO]KUK21425.1 MAG: Radical SAM domain protein [Pseudothermotoga lettingae]MDI3494082.1 lipoyl synthase [Pseudothermotoga sp.]MDK2884902.1 lipoyl synthase [Pseudothermotoga sp.]GLI48149.1 radical SAM protein [Pseudothermotoga lettingae TMO]
MILRASVGTLSKLNISKSMFPPDLKTAYLMLDGKCRFNCLYCSHAISSISPQRFLSRVTWPLIDKDVLIEKISHSDFERICIQTVSYKGYQDDLRLLLKDIVPLGKKVSISVRAENIKEIEDYFNLGVDRIGIAVDVVNEKLFSKIRGGNFKFTLSLIERSAKLFPKKISTHIIVGLGENDSDLLKIMIHFYELGVEVGLFAFTPLNGTPLQDLERPPIERYRRIQIARYLIFTGRKELVFLDQGIIRFRCIPDDAIKAFLTSGCPGCSRPYYNDRPGKSLYNVHSEKLLLSMDLSREVKW